MAGAGIGYAAGGGVGAATALNTDANNRQLHPDEVSKLHDLKAGKSAEKQQRLSDAACALTHCAAGVSDSDPVKAVLTASEQRGQSDSDEQRTLKSTGMFTYNGDYNSGWGLDSTKDWNSRNQATTRALGGVQAFGGGLAIISGAALSPSCETGIGCVGALWLAGTGADNIQSGVRTAWNGTPTPTLGGQVLQGLGLSPNTAELVYGVTQLAPIGGEAIAANRAANALAQANEEARASYASSNAMVNQADLEILSQNGVKFTPENVLATGRTPDGQVVFLETGTPNAGLQHIIKRHGFQFENKEIAESDIPSVVMNALSKGEIIGTNGAAPVYKVMYNGQEKYIAIGVSSNGYIVRSNPVSKWKALK